MRLDLITGNTVVFREIASVYSTDRSHRETVLLHRSQTLVMFVYQLLHCSPTGINDVLHCMLCLLHLSKSQKKTSASRPDRFDIWQQNPSCLIEDLSDPGSKPRAEEKKRWGRRRQVVNRMEQPSVLF